MKIQVGIAGEVRCVLRKADGTVKTDTGFQKNLILNQGLDFFGGGHGANMTTYCAIGSGGSTPVATQTHLDAFAAITRGLYTPSASDYTYTDDGSDTYKTSTTHKYTFTGVDDVNVSEVGLVSSGSASSNYYLCTRVLIKDSLGAPTTISVKSDETLDIYYKVWQVYSTLDSEHVINVSDGSGGIVPYNATVRLESVGDNISRVIGAPATALYDVGAAWSGDLGSIEATPTGGLGSLSMAAFRPYVPSSYKVIFDMSAGLAVANGDIRCISTLTRFLFSQMRLGSVDGDLPLTKTDKEELNISFELSWGRYEGALD